MYICKMKFFHLLLVCFFNSLFCQAQHNLKHTFSFPDSIQKKRLWTVTGAQAAIWGSSMYALNKAWYANYPKSSFHFYNDIQEWQQVDKFGHAWSAYWGAQLSSGLFRWAGVPQKRAALYGAGMGIAYVSLIEILDGFSAEWGFSWGDISFNTAGSLLFAGQEIAWQEQRIQYKFSSHIQSYPNAAMQQRAHNLFGQSTAEKVLKDYNHQTYWLSVNIWSFAKQSKIPKWLNLAVGYGADGMLGGYENFGIDKITNQPYNFSNTQRIRQFYFSPDIDLSKIEWGHKKLKVLKVLQVLKLKFPLPTLEFNTGNNFNWHWMYF